MKLTADTRPILRVARRYSALPPDQLHHRARERFRFFLRQIVSRARYDAMAAAAGELRRGRRAIGRGGNPVTLSVQCDGGHRNDGQGGQPSLQVGILRIAVSQTEAMAIAMDHHIDIVRIVVRFRRPLESGVIEMPVRRPLLP
jgi:hypothetical protein